jgi:hypothetical protein
MSVASEEDNRSTASLSCSKSLQTYIFICVADFRSFWYLVTPLFPSGSSSPTRPFSSLRAFVSWIIQPLSRDTVAARQESKNSLQNFYEFVEHLCEIAGQNKGHNHSMLFSCLNFFDAVSAKLSRLPQRKNSSRFYPSNIIFAFLQVRAFPVISKPSN